MLVIKKINHGTAALTSVGSTLIISANGLRKGLSIGGHTSVGLWIGLGVPAVIGTGLFVPAGLSYEFDKNKMWQGDVNGILASGAGQSVGTAEFV